MDHIIVGCRLERKFGQVVHVPIDLATGRTLGRVRKVVIQDEVEELPTMTVTFLLEGYSSAEVVSPDD